MPAYNKACIRFFRQDVPDGLFAAGAGLFDFVSPRTRFERARGRGVAAMRAIDEVDVVGVRR